MPIVTVHSVDDAVPLSQTLIENGIPCIEITCRTPCAIDAMQAIKESQIDILLGAGTVTNARMLEQVVAVGVDFVVSPGITPSLLEAAADKQIPILPGVSSASEVMLCMDYGLRYMKLFPATHINAIALLKSLYAPLPDAEFCPTGGVNTGNLQEFMQLPNVFCAGGSWIAPTQQISDNHWEQIGKSCRDSLALLATT